MSNWIESPLIKNISWRHYFILIRMAIILKMENAGEEVEKLEHMSCWWECKMVQFVENSWAVPQKAKHRITV